MANKSREANVVEGVPDAAFAAAMGAVVVTAALVLGRGGADAVERVVGYMLLVVGYLSLPGFGVLLVRRRRFLDGVRRGVAGAGAGTSASTSWGAMFRGGVGRKLADCTVVREWGADDCTSVQCAVCLGGVCCGETVRVLPCSHAFHVGCADSWLVDTGKNSCPMCMAVVCPSPGETGTAGAGKTSMRL